MPVPPSEKFKLKLYRIIGIWILASAYSNISGSFSLYCGREPWKRNHGTQELSFCACFSPPRHQLL